MQPLKRSFGERRVNALLNYVETFNVYTDRPIYICSYIISLYADRFVQGTLIKLFRFLDYGTLTKLWCLCEVIFLSLSSLLKLLAVFYETYEITNAYRSEFCKTVEIKINALPNPSRPGHGWRSRNFLIFSSSNCQACLVTLRVISPRHLLFTLLVYAKFSRHFSKEPVMPTSFF